MKEAEKHNKNTLDGWLTVKPPIMLNPREAVLSRRRVTVNPVVVSLSSAWSPISSRQCWQQNRNGRVNETSGQMANSAPSCVVQEGASIFLINIHTHCVGHWTNPIELTSWTNHATCYQWVSFDLAKTESKLATTACKSFFDPQPWSEIRFSLFTVNNGVKLDSVISEGRHTERYQGLGVVEMGHALATKARNYTSLVLVLL